MKFFVKILILVQIQFGICQINVKEGLNNQIKNLSISLRISVLNIPIHKKARLEGYFSPDLDDTVLVVNTENNHNKYKQFLESTKKDNKGKYDFTKTYQNLYEFNKDAYGYAISDKTVPTKVYEYNNSQKRIFTSKCQSSMVVDRVHVFEEIFTLFTLDQIFDGKVFDKKAQNHFCTNFKETKLADIVLCNFIIPKDTDVLQSKSDISESLQKQVEKITPETLKNVEFLLYDTQAMNLAKNEKAKYDDPILNQDDIMKPQENFIDDINGYLLNNSTYVMVSKANEDFQKNIPQKKVNQKTENETKPEIPLQIDNILDNLTSSQILNHNLHIFVSKLKKILDEIGEDYHKKIGCISDEIKEELWQADIDKVKDLAQNLIFSKKLFELKAVQLSDKEQRNAYFSKINSAIKEIHDIYKQRVNEVNKDFRRYDEKNILLRYLVSYPISTLLILNFVAVCFWIYRKEKSHLESLFGVTKLI